MFLSRNKENNVYPCKTQFYYIKVGFKGVKITTTAVSQFDLHSLCISHVCRETIKRYQRAWAQICDITTYSPLQEYISFELCPSQPDASSLLADSYALLDSRSITD